MVYEEVKMDLTKPQLRKLSKGQTCQLKPAQMAGTGVTLLLSRGKVRKLGTAQRKQKGLRLKMSQEEIERSGEGFKDILSKIKRKMKSASPEIRKGLTEAVKVGLPALAVAVGQPELAIPAKIVADTLAKKVVDKVGEKVGFGGRKQYKLKDDYSLFQSPSHPAMNPPYPQLHDMSEGHGLKPTPSVPVKHGKMTQHNIHPALSPPFRQLRDFSVSGGSFKPAGY